MNKELLNYCEQLTKHHKGKNSFTFTLGKKYARIIKDDVCAFCFVDFLGNLYKPESWSKPAKGIRRHISKPLLEEGDFYVK